MADRYSYIPLIGLFIMIGWSFPSIARHVYYRNVVILAACTILISLSICTWFQLKYWESSITLYQHSIDVTKVIKGNTIILNNLANELTRKGRIEEALQLYTQIIVYEPNNYMAHNNLGVVYAQMGKKAEALSQFRKALHIKTDYRDAIRNMELLLKQ